MGIRISNLPPIITPTLNDVFPVDQSGVTYKESISQLITLIGGSGMYVLTAFSGTQHITSGGLEIDSGDLRSGTPTGGAIGSLILYPTLASSGYLEFSATSNAGNTITLITNASYGQASTLTIPDIGASTGNFIMSGLTGAGTQHITSGALEIDSGDLRSGLPTGGNIGSLTLYPTVSAKGYLQLQSTSNAANYSVVITNTSYGQSTVLTVPDIGASTGGIVVSTSPLRMKSIAKAAVAGGAASQTVTDAFCSSTSMVTASWSDTTNPVSIYTVTAGAGSFVVTSSGDPGASHLNYIITK